MAEKEKDPGFTIRDKRTAASDSEGPSPRTAPGPDAAAAEEDRKAGPEPDAATQRPEAGPLPPLDFSGFILSLATSAQVTMGLMPDPHTKVVTKDLAASRQMIDLIALLKEKTNGNLSREEEALVDSVLFNLRMQYVRMVEGKE